MKNGWSKHAFLPSNYEFHENGRLVIDMYLRKSGERYIRLFGTGDRVEIPDTVTSIKEAMAWALAVWRMG